MQNKSKKKRENIYLHVTKPCVIHLYITQKITLKCNSNSTGLLLKTRNEQLPCNMINVDFLGDITHFIQALSP